MKTQSLFVSCLLLTLTAGTVSARQSTPLTSANAGTSDAFGAGRWNTTEVGLGGGASYSVWGCRANFLQSSATTRTNGVQGQITQTCPFAMSMAALPAGATEEISLLSWNYVLDGAPPVTDTIKFNNVAVTGMLVGAGSPDLCWLKGGGVSYVADVTGMVVFDGLNVPDDICDKALGSDPAALGEGVTILSIYSFADGPPRIVDIWAGYTSTESHPSGNAIAQLELTAPYTGGAAHFFVNALDGQFGFDDVYINGQLASGVLPGTNAPFDAWTGLAGPQQFDNLYDAGDGEVSALLAPGGRLLRVRTDASGDCIGHTFAAVSYIAPFATPRSPCLP